MPTKDNIKTIKKALGTTNWNKLVKEDASYEIFAAAPWQAPDNYGTNAVTIDTTLSFLESAEVNGKLSDINWRELQKQCWHKYKTFGPLNASIESKANYVVGPGFMVYSEILEINEFLKDLYYSYRNKLYARVIGWMIRMLAEGEIFVLIALDENGTATIRTLEPTQIGEGDEKGLVVDPDDATQTLYYQYKATKGEEYIPDARWIIEPELMLERSKELNSNDLAKIKRKISKSTKGSGAKFKKVGGYRRFVLHLKNLTGIPEYQRDTASLVTTLEWINLYVQALKWELDHKKALAAHTHDFKFTSDPQGRIMWNIWQNMTAEQKAGTGLTKPYTPGSKNFIPPGIEHEVKAPQLNKMSGSNQDLLNLAGSGAKTPQDMWQGQVAGQTYAGIKSTRPPMMFDIESLQHIFGHFFVYEFLRVCVHAKVMLGGKVITAPGTKNSSLKILPAYKETVVTEINKGKPKTQDIDVEPIRKIELGFPVVKLDTDPDKTVNSSLGSKHTGWHGMGVSRETLAKRGGYPIFSKEFRHSLLEKEKYGDVASGAETEKKVEKKLEGEGAE